MSQSSFVPAYGSAIAYSNTSGGTYTKVMQTVDINTPPAPVGKISITNNDSPTGGNPNGCKEYQSGMTDPGSFEFDVVYYKTGHATLNAMKGNGFTYSWKETFQDTTVATFPAYIEDVTLEGKTEDDAMKGKVKLQLTGPVVWT